MNIIDVYLSLKLMNDYFNILLFNRIDLVPRKLEVGISLEVEGLLPKEILVAIPCLKLSVTLLKIPSHAFIIGALHNTLSVLFHNFLHFQ